MYRRLLSDGSLFVISMRWVARLVSIVWSFWATFWTLFVLGHFIGEASFFPIAAFVLIGITFALMAIGAAIIASVWKLEALGGALLLVHGVLMLALTVWQFDPHSTWVSVIAFWTMILPPLVSGILFLTCHRKSNNPGVPRV